MFSLYVNIAKHMQPTFYPQLNDQITASILVLQSKRLCLSGRHFLKHVWCCLNDHGFYGLNNYQIVLVLCAINWEQIVYTILVYNFYLNQIQMLQSYGDKS